MLKPFLFVALTLTPLLSGCGLFSGEDDPFDIVFREEVPVEFTIDASDFCPTNLDCNAAEGDSPDRIVLPDFEFAIPIDVLTATGSTQLSEVSQRLKSVEVEKVEYTYSGNSLNIETPKIALFVGGTNVSTHEKGVLIVDVPTAAPGKNSTGTAAVESANKSKSSDILKTLRFSMIPFMQPAAIEKGQPSPPKGSADVKLVMTLKFVANPTEL